MAKRGVIYAKFEAFGEQLAHCYFLLQERFIAEPVLSRFWAEAALEELQHHSMLTAMLVVENILDGDEHDVWAVNVEEEYHEEHRATRPRAGTGRDAPILPRTG